MSKKNRGRLVGGIGIAAVLAALIKFGAIGFYPDEVLPYGALLVVGVVLFWLGNRMYTQAKEGA